MANYVLDASALLALLNAEPGWQKVQTALHHHQTFMSTVNYAEVMAKLLSLDIPVDTADAVMLPLGIHLVALEASVARQSALLYPFTKALGLSLGDRVCLALGIYQTAKVLTADKIWKAVQYPGLTVQLIRE